MEGEGLILYEELLILLFLIFVFFLIFYVREWVGRVDFVFQLVYGFCWKVEFVLLVCFLVKINKFKWEL